jgi:peptidoglycan/xylan/chitin deacetylase (PgdA/CDA1 family)
MKKWVFFILIIILFVTFGLIFYLSQSNWKIANRADIVITPKPTAATAENPDSEFLPLSETLLAKLNYQKPAEDTTIEFPVFNYHHIRPMPSVASSTITDRAFTVSPEGFETHLKYFKENGYEVVLIDELIEYFDMGKPLPQKAVAITFDDGRYGQYKWAYPLLRRYGMTATFFITTDWIGRDTFMNWNQIKEMSENGMVIGSHSLSHVNLTTLSDETLKKELEDSKKIIEEKINPSGQSEGEVSRKIDYLAYPGGNFNEHVIEFARAAGYKAGLGVYKIINQEPKYRYMIRRFHADDALESITNKLTEY